MGKEVTGYKVPLSYENPSWCENLSHHHFLRFLSQRPFPSTRYSAMAFFNPPKRGPRAAKAAMATGFKAVEKKADTDHIL